MTSKSVTGVKQCSKECCSQSHSSVFIIKDLGCQAGEKGSIVQLRHPRTSSPALFLFSPNNKVVHEIIVFSPDKPRSFFIGDQVKSDGKVFLSTPVDPLYLALPYLKKYGKCSPLDHIITDDDFPEIERLLECDGLKLIHHLVDQKGDTSLNAYIYNEEKALRWLERKVKRVADSLKEKGIHVSSNNALSANFVQAVKSEDEEEGYLRYAAGLVSSYLPEEVSELLEKKLGLPPLPEIGERKRKSAPGAKGQVNGEARKKQRTEGNEEETNGCDDGPNELLSPSVKEKKSTPSAKEKALKKAASGSKNIMAFFKKK